MIEQDSKIVLRTQNLSIGYTSKNKASTIVKGIDIGVERGNLIGLVGINGSGKSTLLRTLAGLHPTLSGEIHIGKILLQEATPQLLAQKLSVVLTDKRISQQLTVYDLVALGRQPYTGWLGQLSRDDHTIVKKAIQLAQLDDLQERSCGTLSDGQLQRAFIARALAQNTSLILMDEPLSHLDLHHKASLLSLMQQITQEQGKTIIFATHEISHVLPLCDAFMVIQNGQLLFDNTIKLIEQDVFNGLFPSELVLFDKKTKQYKIHTENRNT